MYNWKFTLKDGLYMNTNNEIEKLEVLLSFGSLIVVLVIWGLLRHYHVPLRGLLFFPKVK